MKLKYRILKFFDYFFTYTLHPRIGKERELWRIDEKWTAIYHDERQKMRHLGYLEKGEYTIRISGNEYGHFDLEYSKDGFITKTKKSYRTKDELMEVLLRRFSEEELKFL